MSTETKPIPQWWEDPEQVALLKRTHLQKATPDEAETFIGVCKRTGLDPFARQIYATFRNLKDKKGQWYSKMEIQASIDGFRVVAQRSGEYQGQTPALWCGQDGVWKDVWLSQDYPKACKIGVHRKDFKEPLIAVASWDSYVQTTRGEGEHAQPKVGHMWAKMPDLMLSKVAEALALRRAFPQDLSGLYTSDETGQVGNPAPSKDDQTSPHRPEDENQDDKPALPPLKPGTFQNAPTVEDPAKAVKTPPAASQTPKTPPPDDPQITRWQDIPYTFKKGSVTKTKKLGTLSKTYVDDLAKFYLNREPKNKDEALVKAALAQRQAELNPETWNDKLAAQCEAEKIDIAIVLKVAQQSCGSEATDFFDISEDDSHSLLDNWDKTLEQVKFELDQLP